MLHAHPIRCLSDVTALLNSPYFNEVTFQFTSYFLSFALRHFHFLVFEFQSVVDNIFFAVKIQQTENGFMKRFRIRYHSRSIQMYLVQIRSKIERAQRVSCAFDAIQVITFDEYIKVSPISILVNTTFTLGCDVLFCLVYVDF